MAVGVGERDTSAAVSRHSYFAEAARDITHKGAHFRWVETHKHTVRQLTQHWLLLWSSGLTCYALLRLRHILIIKPTPL